MEKPLCQYQGIIYSDSGVFRDLFALHTEESYRTGCEADVLFMFHLSEGKSEALTEREMEGET